MTKLITRYELATLTLAELLTLYRILNEKLNKTSYGTAKRLNCLASLENTIHEINRRYGYQWNMSVGP